MSYQADVYNVMLASPSDVTAEREIAREIILDWNNINSFTRKIVLLPLGWEYNAIPTMGNRPQEIINNQVLKNADILIGIFWTRIGTPTGKAISGTVEEIEEHIKSGKPAMLYFSKQPAVPDSIDSEQYAAVRRLKAEFQSNGLTYDFDSIDNFKIHFQRHLAMKMNEDEYFKNFNENGNGRSPSGSNGYLLSEYAKTLLLEISKDNSGQLIKIGSMGVFHLETNGRQLNEDSEPRTKAKWEAALNELLNFDLVSPIGYKGEMYQITDLGYTVADKNL